MSVTVSRPVGALRTGDHAWLTFDADVIDPLVIGAR
jgi:hypothetical protein